ncbi:MAG: hypothetical protein II222_00670 [Paraprevotella sp.]|nr:hypothetical protein [Paraprevotella sp.]
MAQKFHHYALNANKNLIHIKDTEGFENEKYYCPNCGDEMITKRGKVRNWHYAHKKADCSYDNYLHSLAELKIKDWFNREQTISLILDSHEQCDNHNTCKFYNKEQCKKAIQNRYNLKKFYTSCIIEHKYKGFIADIFCINKKENGEPIFIEIYVTHKCEEEKLNSGIRIIEIKIQNEEDIDEIISSNELKENKKIKLFNFKKVKPTQRK